jgi:hypothetical protein
MMEQTLALKSIIAINLWTVAFLLGAAGTLILAINGQKRLPVAMALLGNAILLMGGGATLTIKILMDRNLREVRRAFHYTQNVTELTRGPGLVK